MSRSASLLAIILMSALGCGDSGNPADNGALPPDPVLTSGTVTIPTYQGIDMETGAFSNLLTTADLYARTLGDPPYFELFSPGSYSYFGTKAPRRSECHGGLAQAYHLDTLPGDVYSCIVTKAGHYGYFHFPHWPPWGMDSVRVAYVLWAD